VKLGTTHGVTRSPAGATRSAEVCEREGVILSWEEKYGRLPEFEVLELGVAELEEEIEVFLTNVILDKKNGTRSWSCR